MAFIDLNFPVFGQEIPSDHAYALYGAISRLVPAVHAVDFPLRIAPIRGEYLGQGKRRLDPRGSVLHLRLPVESLPTLLPLAGKSLDLMGHAIRLGVPNVQALLPATSLIARMVVMKASERTNSEKRKRYTEPAEFLEAIRKDLSERNIGATADLPLHDTGPHLGQPRRHVVRVKGRAIVGFSVLIQGLTADESIRLQEEGIGGRAKLGGGFFVAWKERV